jgi:hypothetical protein
MMVYVKVIVAKKNSVAITGCTDLHFTLLFIFWQEREAVVKK